MDKLWKNLRGTLLSIFGIGTVNLKDNAGVLEAKNEADDALINVSVADPTQDTHAATKNYVDDQISTVNPDSAGTMRVMRFAIDNTASQESPTTLPANARIKEIRLEVTTAYDSGKTIKVGNTADDDLLMPTDYNKPSKLGTYSVEQDSQWSALAETVKVAISESSVAGAGVINVFYAIA